MSVHAKLDTVAVFVQGSYVVLVAERPKCRRSEERKYLLNHAHVLLSACSADFEADKL